VGGDDEFDEFFRADFPLLVGFLGKAEFELEVARDAAAEAMLHAFKVWKSISFPRAWVRRVGLRMATEQDMRRDGVGRAIRSGWVRSIDDTEDKLFAFVEDSSFVVTLLGRLPERQRVVMAWSLDGFTSLEIAEGLGVGEATVRFNLRHARERLAQIHQNELVDPSEEGT
jgi:RNA polymerase sigma-70 factor (ECF subfamily)